MEILVLLVPVLLFGWLAFKVIKNIFFVRSTKRVSRSWEKRFAELEAALERERKREEEWEIVRSRDWSVVPCPALCSECKEGEREPFDFFGSGRDHPADVFIHQAMSVLHGVCVHCQTRMVHKIKHDESADRLHRGPDPDTGTL